MVPVLHAKTARVALNITTLCPEQAALVRTLPGNFLAPLPLVAFGGLRMLFLRSVSTQGSSDEESKRPIPTLKKPTEVLILALQRLQVKGLERKERE